MRGGDKGWEPPETGQTYRDRDGRELTVEYVRETNRDGRDVEGRLRVPDGRAFSYSCTLAAFERVWTQREPELGDGRGNRGGARYGGDGP